MPGGSDRVTWVLETEAFPHTDAALERAAIEAGERVIRWDDAWWSTEEWPKLTDTTVIFHGSLGNAERIRAKLPWRPGAYCAVDSFRCSAWYPRAANWLLH